MTKGKPVGTHILIEPMKVDDLSETIITDFVKTEYQKGKVLALGSGKIEGTEKIDWDIEVGDVVYYSGKGSEINTENGTKLFIRHGQIYWAE